MSKTNPRINRAPKLREFVRQEPHPAAADSVHRALQVPASLERLNYCVDDLASVVSALMARLEPTVLGAATTATEEFNRAPSPAQCSVASSIEAQADRICASVAMLRDAADRLEV